ncbi:outer membrane lipid asymmetry maintenance protein MlaD [Micavibrio aeruginosavorus]|uniref:outer membrane lipid asymmetry maintenance protein MlaD n=1 Tax=Micavibrio aeruginosavorus TaxID=349221 RepID=UPI003F4AF447
MKHSLIETVLGAVVLLVAAVFLMFSYSAANVGDVSGYTISANFSSVGGLRAGDDVQISGVKVGTVSSVELDPETYLAKVSMAVDPSVKVPDDSAALISSESLMGGRYLSLEPGSSEDMMKSGDRISYTQAPQNLEQLLGKFIFSMQGAPKDQGGNGAEPSDAHP